MLYLFYGPDSFSRHEALASLRSRLDSDGMLTTNTTTLDARSLTLDQLTMVCDALPFLAAHRLVHVQGLLARAQAERPAGARRGSRAPRHPPTDAAEGWLALADYVDRMPPTTVLVLEDGDIRDTNPLRAALAVKASEVKVFRRLSVRDLEGWIGERARRRGVLFESPALRVLAEAAPVDPGEDGHWHTLWWLTGEIEKLSLYVPQGARISTADVQRLVPAALESRAYLLSDKVLDRQGGEALSLLEELLTGGRPAPVLLATLAGRLRQLIVLRELVDARVPKAEMQARTGLNKSWQFDQLRRQAERLPMARLESTHERLVETDRAIKSGRVDEVTALETLVADLAGL